MIQPVAWLALAGAAALVYLMADESRRKRKPVRKREPKAVPETAVKVVPVPAAESVAGVDKVPEPAKPAAVPAATDPEETDKDSDNV